MVDRRWKRYAARGGSASPAAHGGRSARLHRSRVGVGGKARSSRSPSRLSWPRQWVDTGAGAGDGLSQSAGFGARTCRAARRFAPVKCAPPLPRPHLLVRRLTTERWSCPPWASGQRRAHAMGRSATRRQTVDERCRQLALGTAEQLSGQFELGDGDGGWRWTRTSGLLHVKHFRLSAVLRAWRIWWAALDWNQALGWDTRASGRCEASTTPATVHGGSHLSTTSDPGRH